MSAKTIVQSDPRRTLKQIREEMGLARVEIAEKIGVTAATIQNWEEGINHPNMRYLPAIEDAYNTDRGLIRLPFEPQKDRVIKAGDPDGDVVSVRVMIVSADHSKELERKIGELRQSIDCGDKKRSLALVDELEQVTRVKETSR